MPADYELVSVQQQDQWSSDYGTFQSYDLVVAGPGAPNTPVRLNRKLKDGAVPQDKIPQQGQTLYLEIQGTKAKEVQRDAPPSSNGAGRTDATGRSIEAQVAAKCAADVVSAQAGGKEQLATKSLLAEYIHFLTATFYSAIQEAQNPAIQGGTLQPPADPAPESGGASTTRTPSDAEIPFRPV